MINWLNQLKDYPLINWKLPRSLFQISSLGRILNPSSKCMPQSWLIACNGHWWETSNFRKVDMIVFMWTVLALCMIPHYINWLIWQLVTPINSCLLWTYSACELLYITRYSSRLFTSLCECVSESSASVWAYPNHWDTAEDSVYGKSDDAGSSRYAGFESSSILCQDVTALWCTYFEIFKFVSHTHCVGDCDDNKYLQCW